MMFSFFPLLFQQNCYFRPIKSTPQVKTFLLISTAALHLVAEAFRLTLFIFYKKLLTEYI